MTETLSKVYDIVYPSPITLKKISSIVTAVELWRHEIIIYLNSKKSSNDFHFYTYYSTVRLRYSSTYFPIEFCLTKRIALKHVIPGLPSAIYDLLREYTNTFRNSLHKWLDYHSEYVFDDEYKGGRFDYILQNFYDFVWDWNGGIDYVRTAKLMLQCDRFSAYEKYRIAYLYCFEDDITRIWPFVSAKMDGKSIPFYKYPSLGYWTCNYGEVLYYYKYKPRHHVPDPNTYEKELVSGRLDNRSSLEYFWRRIPSKNQLKIATQMLARSNNLELFARSILSQLCGHRLEKFVNSEGAVLISRLLLDDSNPDCALAIWMYIRNTIKEYTFHCLVKELLLEKRNKVFVNGRSISFSFLCCEIWNTAPQHLKQWIFDNLLIADSVFPEVRTYTCPTALNDMIFLITILRDATSEQRNIFWNNNWRNLLSRSRVEDLLAVMKLCFRDDHEMTLFKETTMATNLYENIKQHCNSLLKDGHFEIFNDFVSFCCTDTLKRKELKEKLLRWSYLEENYSRVNIFRQNHKLLNKCIDDVFETSDLRVEFKNEFISSPGVLNSLRECIELGNFTVLIEFVNAFASQEGVAIVPLKRRLFDHFKQYVISAKVRYTSGDHIQKILVWLLGNEDEVAKFKQSLLADDVFHAVMQTELKESTTKDDKIISDFLKNFHHFLMWYFDKDEEKIDSFWKQYDMMNLCSLLRSKKK